MEAFQSLVCCPLTALDAVGQVPLVTPPSLFPAPSGIAFPDPLQVISLPLSLDKHSWGVAWLQ